jgi:hypothetical protein
VMTGRDPSRLTPHKIEEYLEKQNVIRPRALKQLTRYREDYRNPSTHDYKLDFNEDEALLAIVSVCAFTKLLVNQISGKVAYEAGRDATNTRLSGDYSDGQQLGRDLANVVAGALSKIVAPSLFQHNDLIEYIGGVIGENGAEAELFLDNDGSDEELPWDIIANYQELNCSVEPRIIGKVDVRFSVGWVHRLTKSGNTTVLVLFDDKMASNYSVIYKQSRSGGTIFLILPEEDLPHWSPNVKQVISELRN